MLNYYKFTNYRWKNYRLKKLVALSIICILGILVPIFSKVQFALSVEQTNMLNGKVVISGIVEENNTALGYITIYNPDEQEDMIQIYNYLDPQKVDVIKNRKKAELSTVEEGDTAFIELDQNGYVISISAVSNYDVKYGIIIRKSPLSITVEYDNKEQEAFRINSETGISHRGKKCNYQQLKDGDNVKLLVHGKSNSEVLKNIVILEEKGYDISNIYKGVINRIDGMTKKLFTANLLQFTNGRWERAGIKGISGFKLSKDFSIYKDNQEINISEVNNYFKNNEAYIAVKRDYGGQEQVAIALLRDEFDSEIIYNDSVIKTMSGSGSFNLAGDLRNIFYTNQSIVLKNQRLVTGLSISEDDRVYVVANRNSEGQYKAGLVQIYNKIDADLPGVYRGRIKSINEYGDFTIESYSILEDFGWKFYNTPKTFNITFDTRILNDNGLTGQEDFMPYGEESYIGKVVYIIADGLNASLVSTAPYGSYNYKGEVYQLNGATIGQEGGIIQEPKEINIVNVKLYDTAQKIWINSKEANIEILNNSIILKNGDVIKPSKLEKGDKVRIIKKDKTNTGAAYLIIVERR